MNHHPLLDYQETLFRDLVLCFCLLGHLEDLNYLLHHLQLASSIISQYYSRENTWFMINLSLEQAHLLQYTFMFSELLDLYHYEVLFYSTIFKSSAKVLV